MWGIEQVKEYFYIETRDFEVTEVVLEETKHSYYDTVDCFLVKTAQGIDFYVFVGGSTLPWKAGKGIKLCHIAPCVVGLLVLTLHFII